MAFAILNALMSETLYAYCRKWHPLEFKEISVCVTSMIFTKTFSFAMMPSSVLKATDKYAQVHGNCATWFYPS